jgi:uncharacterized membrane protein
MTGSAERSAAYHADGDSRKTLDRLMAFSDAVFAIAMTLLVVQFAVPAIPRGLPKAEVGHRLASELAALGPAYFSFGLTFVVVAIYWIAHHRKFLYLRRHDTGLIWLNLLLLLCVAFIPFPTAVLGRYGDQAVAAVFYAATLAVTGVLSVAMTAYASWRGLGDPAADPRELRFGIARGAVIPVVFLASIPLALVSPRAAEWSWLVIFVVNRVVQARRRHHDAPG